jgi:hypothetical protein
MSLQIVIDGDNISRAVRILDAGGVICEASGCDECDRSGVRNA